MQQQAKGGSGGSGPAARLPQGSAQKEVATLPTRVQVSPNAYYDSVTLMVISQQAAELPGVRNAVALMGTEMNKQLLQHIGLLDGAAAAAGPTDLLLAVAADAEAVLDEALAQMEELLRRRAPAGAPGAGAAAAPRTIAAAMRRNPAANLALVSTPGIYAAREARLALEQGLHVMLYSDNVPVAPELALKQLAHERGLLLMGPDCGTAILNGTGLGFANAVRKGNIGVVAASGTGAQELSTLIDRLGGGISQLIGTGGRDLSAAVGGIMTLDGLRLLQEDPETAVIVVISKPPAPEVAERVRQAVTGGTKPAVFCLLGEPGGVSIDQAAVQAVHLATGVPQAELEAALGYGAPLPRLTLAPGRRYGRGLFSGGTLCDQALLILEERLGPVQCNVHPNPERRGGSQRSAGHTLVDLGDDEFTRGRPHPMIDPGLRRERLLQEAADPETAVILLDIVTGYGSHADPAGALADAIAAATRQGIAVVAAVTGTAADPQRRDDQEARLRAAGAHVLPTARLAAQTVAAALGSE